MDEEKNEEIKDEESVETGAEETDDNREEETKDEIRDNIYANDDIINMLKEMNKRIDTMDEKMDSMISMKVDSGAIINEGVDDISEQERSNYEDDFINIDEMDLSL